MKREMKREGGERQRGPLPTLDQKRCVASTAFDSLSARQRSFVVEYMRDFNATQAAVRTGYSLRSARSIGSENLTKPNITKAIEEQLVKAGVTSDRIMVELAKMAFGMDIADFDGLAQGKSLSELRAAGVPTRFVKKIKTRREVEGRGEDQKTFEVREYEMHDPVRALEDLAKIKKMFTDGGTQPQKKYLFTEEALGSL